MICLRFELFGVQNIMRCVLVLKFKVEMFFVMSVVDNFKIYVDIEG